MDVLVITEIRIFRITGVPAAQAGEHAVVAACSTSPWSVRCSGAIFHYGHFTFESAAQTQGMQTVKYVPDPFYWEKLILYHVHTSSSRSKGGATGSSR